MEITWNELLAKDQNKRIEILASIYAEYLEFQKYRSMLNRASLERASVNSNTEITMIND
jgi:hypothetical protein